MREQVHLVLNAPRQNKTLCGLRIADHLHRWWSVRERVIGTCLNCGASAVRRRREAQKGANG